MSPLTSPAPRAAHPPVQRVVEVTGRRLRKMMPWLKAKEPPKAS